MTDLTATAEVRDPDGDVRIVTHAEADAMVERGEATICLPDADEDYPVHWHRHDRWPE